MKTIISLAAFYLFLLVIMTLFQRKFIYYPYKLDREFEYPRYVPQQEEIFITCGDGSVINGLYAPGRENNPDGAHFPRECRQYHTP